MAHRLSSPPLIKGIDGIVSRPPNEVNYSVLNEKSMETRKQPGNEIRRKFKKYGLRQKERYVKEEQREEFHRILSNVGAQNSWMSLAMGYGIPMKDVVSDGKECDVAGEPQGNTVRRKFRKFGLKKMERNMKEGNYTGTIMNLTVPGNESKNEMMTTIEEYDGEEDGAKEEEKVECERKNTEVAAAGGENEDLDATGVIGATGATEDDSTSTTGEDGAVNEDDGLILEDEENEDLGATGVIGATGSTEDDSNSTIGEYGARNEDDSRILKEGEIVEQPGNILRRKYKQIWTKKLAQNLKEGKYTSRIEILNRRVNKNEIDMIENKVEDDGEEDGVIREAQQQK